MRYFLLLSLSLFLSCSSFLSVLHSIGQYSINTFAGNGEYGFSGDGGQATAATISSPRGLVNHALAGLVYVAEPYNSCVRVIKTSTGVINTAAGICMSYGYSGDSGPATLATLNGPFDVELDVQSGLLYIADSGNSVIRMVNISSGIITTVAGTGIAGFGGDNGPAISTSLNSPYGVAFDPSSRTLYISDNGNCVIRSLAVATGLISTLVSLGYCGGTGYYGSTSYTDYGGIAVNPSTGTVYFTDPNGVCLKAVTVATLNVVTVAGNGIYGNAGDGGIATEASFGMLSGVAVNTTTGDIYIADSNYNVIRVVNIITGIINTVAGTGSTGYSGDGGLATSANLYSPTGISVHPTTGIVYISDTYNLRIRVLSSDIGNLGET